MNTLNEFGNFLRELRGKRSLREMERLTGLSHTYLSSLEKGVDPRSGKERKPTPEALKQISDAFPEVSYMSLLAKAGYVNTFGRTLKKFRENEGWTIKKLSMETLNTEYGTPIFISEKRLIDLESESKIDPSVFEIYLLSQAFGVYPWDFPRNGLITPEQDFVTFLEVDTLPDPFAPVNSALNILYKELIKTEDNQKRLELVKKIEGIKENKKRYVQQLNALSANGEDVIQIDQDTLDGNDRSDSLYILDEDEEQNFLFLTPTKEVEVNGKTFFATSKRKEHELSFFDLVNLINLHPLVNFKGKILSKEQKNKIIQLIEDNLD